ncbi:MAG: hypothetical protein ACJA1Z_001603 [Patiriisocius sp.]|jgi:hypothetical protein
MIVALKKMNNRQVEAVEIMNEREFLPFYKTIKHIFISQLNCSLLYFLLKILV